MQSSTPDLKFKFKFFKDGQIRGLLAKKGTATQEALVLGGESLSYGQISDTTVRGKRLMILLSPQPSLSPKLSKLLIDGHVLALDVYNVKALDLEHTIDRTCSYQAARRHKQQLDQAGQGELFRAARCPECQAVIDLTDLPRTPYIYCRFCETVFTAKKQIATKGSTYRVCDECGMFDRVRSYTEFYFYFLLVVYGFSWKELHLCDNCAHKMFVRTLLLNFIFILGVPVSIYAKLKSLTGRERDLKTLSKANALSLAGKHQQAAPIYQQLYQKHPEHPGLRTNEGIGHLRGNDVQGAIQCFERAMKVCSNYLPAMQLIRQMQSASIRPRP